MPNGVDTVSLEHLKLDLENPRLPAYLLREETPIIDFIATKTSLEGLMSAIAENGFFPGEPLVVVPIAETAPQEYTVVEGNRRLCALKLIQNPQLLSRPQEKITEISEQAEYKPTEIPVVIRESREEVLPYLGYRHITGVKAWEPLSKARYIYQLFISSDEQLEPSQRYYEVAQRIGTRRDFIKRNLDALAVYNIIEENNFFDIDDLGESSIKFGVLSTALANEKIACFTGLSKLEEDGDTTPLHPSINSDVINVVTLEELIQWMYASDDKGQTRVGESRNLVKLASVVADQKALSAFRTGASLQSAYEKTKHVRDDFLTLLYQAESALSEAAGLVATVEYETAIWDIAYTTYQHSRLIVKELKDQRDRLQGLHDDDL